MNYRLACWDAWLHFERSMDVMIRPWPILPCKAEKAVTADLKSKRLPFGFAYSSITHLSITVSVFHTSLINVWHSTEHYALIITYMPIHEKQSKHAIPAGIHFASCPAKARHTRKAQLVAHNLMAEDDISRHRLNVAEIEIPHSKHETLTHCWLNDGPPSATMAQHWTNSGSKSRVFWVQ